MSVFVNLHAVPPGQSLYTLAVTACPPGTPPDARYCDEVDVLAPTSAPLSSLLRDVDLDGLGYGGCRIVGVVDQSAGYVLAEDWDGDLR